METSQLYPSLPNAPSPFRSPTWLFGALPTACRRELGEAPMQRGQVLPGHLALDDLPALGVPWPCPANGRRSEEDGPINFF